MCHWMVRDVLDADVTEELVVATGRIATVVVAVATPRASSLQLSTIAWQAPGWARPSPW